MVGQYINGGIKNLAGSRQSDMSYYVSQQAILHTPSGQA